CKDAGIGGVMIYELWSGWLAGAPAGQKDPLLQAVKQEVFGTVPPPPPPTLVSPSNGSTGISINPKLSWNPSSGAVSYRLQVATTSNFSQLVLDQSGITGTTFTLSNLLSDTVYYWRVSASNNSGTSNWSTTWSFRTKSVLQIKGALFFDQNANRVKDLTEPAIPGWGIQLQGTASLSTLTDSGGFYVFEDLQVGSYTVSLEQRPLWNQTFPVNPGTYSITLDDNNPVGEADFGIHSSNAFSFRVDKYWNISSLPVRMPDNRTSYVFPLATTPVYEYLDAYIERDNVANGPGYWVKFPVPHTVWVAGQSIEVDTIEVREGWNIVGSISSPVPVSEILLSPPGVIISHFFNYAGGAFIANTILPGEGYWVKANGAGSIILSSLLSSKSTPVHFDVMNLEHMSSLTFITSEGISRKLFFSSNPEDRHLNSQFELPPPPPQGVFDVRFPPQSEKSFGSMINVILENDPAQVELPITIRSATYPLTVSWQIKTRKLKFVLDCGEDNISLSTERGEVLIEPSQVDNVQNGVTRIKIRIENNEVLRTPASFSLMQNYPNPFNNITVIPFTLPEESFVQLEVLNILGKKVASPLNRQMTSGTHTMPFETSNLPSGVYFYKITAESKDKKVFTQTRRMILLK
ncbi:MAG: T9SS type A sorting domain-containing protein, partial [Ignavibacteriae bacterium]|nr:T9SS type A sorting domain-containing protein [Ignavibacteriota bacterium]